MELNLAPELEAKLNELAATTGRRPDELIEDAVQGYMNELAQVRSVLDSRYDDVVSGRVETIDGEEALDRLRKTSEARRNA